MSQSRIQELSNYCQERLQSIESLLENTTSFNFAPMLKLRLVTKQNILKHLVDHETCFNFASVEDLAKYIEDRTDIICGFYED